MELPFFLKSLLTIFIFSTFPSFRCEDNENFKTCDLPYGCGEIKNLAFPFWGDDRPQICGNAGFELSCKNREYPVIDMDGLEYRVLNVSQETRVMTLARSDLWDTPCSRKAQNTTLNMVFFPNYPATVENLTFIYDCPENELLGESLYFLNNFTCSGEAGSENRISYYVRENLLGTLNSSVVQRVCNGGVVQVPASRTALDEIERSAEGGVEQVTEVLRKGFDVQYMEFPVCSSCENSGGRCGSNNSTAQFSCYCPDGTEYSSCLRKSDSSPPVVHEDTTDVCLPGYND